MIENPLLYLLTLAFIVTFFYLLESKSHFKVFTYLPAVVIIYAFNMFLASFGVYELNDGQKELYTLTKTNLLPAMLFLMLLQVDFSQFIRLGKSLVLAYTLSVLSIAFSFIVIASFFSFSQDMAAAFGALAGSWMGGTANMVAVGSALGVSEEAFAYALVVDSVNYTIWVMFLLFLVPFAKGFNNFTKASWNTIGLGEIACACTMGTPRYWSLILLALGVSLLTQFVSKEFVFISETTSMVLFATLFGVIGSFTRLRELYGSSELATTMLYLLVALIGSQAIIESFWGVGLYVFAGMCILLLHALIMVVSAKIFKLDLFSIAVASLANIGGVASAPILAAAYDKRLVGIGVLMAIMGYLAGTFGGLFVGNILLELSK
ncbi:MAG: DUF819 domain-containing protein [Campylobacterales bacterium]|nr:DUF819 domain-containing protein [Campylobacterales bacterium]